MNPFLRCTRCTDCGAEFEPSPDVTFCPSCGGITEICYDLAAIRRVWSRDALASDKTTTLWRYAPLLPAAPPSFGLRAGMTPLYTARKLQDVFGLRALYLKDEGVNPTGSLKDRPSAIAVALALESGADAVACSSTGNAASSLAGHSARAGLRSYIFVPERAPAAKLAQLLVFGAHVISVRGDYGQTSRLSQEAIAHYGWYNRNAGANPHLVDGKKTVALEIAEQLQWDVPDWVALSVGDGCTIAGVYKGFAELHELGFINRIPRLLGVQSAECCPFVNSWQTNTGLTAVPENTLADSIAVGFPKNGKKALRAVENSGGAWIACPDTDILATMRLLGTHEGIFSEPAGAAALCGVKAAVERGIITSKERVAVICSGSGLKDIKNALLATGEPLYCDPKLSEVIQALGA